MSINLEAMPQLGQDKANHLLYGQGAALVAAYAAPFVGALVGVHIDRRAAAMAASTVIGAIKEVWDKVTGKGDPNLWDFLATAAGGVTVALSLSMVG